MRAYAATTSIERTFSIFRGEYQTSCGNRCPSCEPADFLPCPRANGMSTSSSVAWLIIRRSLNSLESQTTTARKYSPAHWRFSWSDLRFRAGTRFFKSRLSAWAGGKSSENKFLGNGLPRLLLNSPMATPWRITSSMVSAVNNFRTVMIWWSSNIAMKMAVPVIVGDIDQCLSLSCLLVRYLHNGTYCHQ